MPDDSTLAELVSRTEDLDLRYGDGLSVDVENVASAPGAVILALVVIQDGAVDSRWNVHVTEPIETRVSIGGHDDVRVTDEHPLLVDIRDDRAELYFKGPVAERAAFIGDLLRAHLDVLVDWRPLGAYVNEAIWQIDLLSFPMGLLADGPITLIDGYEAVLRRHNAFSSRLEHGPAKVWRGELQWQTIDWPPALLLLEGPEGPSPRMAHSASYVIGRSITAERIA